MPKHEGKGKMMNFNHPEHFEVKQGMLPGGSDKYCKYGMDNAKEAKEKADKLAGYVKKQKVNY